MASDEQVAAAILAAINTQLAAYGDGTSHAYDLDDARGVTAEHVQVTLAQRYVDAERAGRQSGAAYRLTTRPVADTVSNGREIDRLTAVALSGANVTAAGVISTPIRRESSDPIGEDDGRYSGLTTWTFAL